MTAVPKPPNLALAPPASGACKQGSLLGQGPQLLRPCPRSKGRESSGVHPGGQVGASHGGQEPCRACVPLGLVRPWVAAPRAEYMQALGLLREGGWLGVEMGRQGPGPPSRLPEPVLVGELPLGTQPAGYCGTCSTDEQLEDQRAPPSGRVGPLGVDQAHLLAREASPGQPQQRREEPEPCSRPLFCAALGSGNVMEPPSHRWLQLWRDPGAARTASAEGSTPLRVPGHGVGGARCPGMCGWLCAPRQRAPSARLRGWGGYL